MSLAGMKHGGLRPDCQQLSHAAQPHFWRPFKNGI